VVVSPRIGRTVGRNIEQTMSVPVGMMVDMLAEERAAGRDPALALDRLRERTRYPARLVRRDEIDLAPPLAERLDAGHRAGEHRPAAGRGAQERDPGAGARPAAGRRVPGAPADPAPARRAVGGGGALRAGRDGGAQRRRRGRRGASFNRMADEIDRLVAGQRELLHVVSHELRTPLQRIHFALEKVRRAPAGEERERAIARMERDLDELDQLIEELLTWTRLREGPRGEAGAVDVAELAAELCELLGEGREGVAVGLAVEGGGGDETIRAAGEPRLVRRAVSNLVVNAIRHARARVQVTVRAGGERVEIDVDDDGGGVPEADRERVFEPFFRRDDGRDAGGAGLGLAIVRRIADRSGGSALALASPALGGARFRLVLPAAAP
jgi:two-component system sensor histidine kinase RstB